MKEKNNESIQPQSFTPKQIVLSKIQFKDGYTSPSGGFSNTARFEIIGINPKTGRKNKREIIAPTETDAIIKAEKEFGFTDIEAVCIPFDKPTEPQLELAKKINVFIPQDADKDDVSCILSRMLDGNRSPEDADFKPLDGCSQKWADYLQSQGIYFSAYISQAHAWNIVTNVGFNTKERCKIYAYCIWCYLNKENLDFHIGHPKENLFDLFADAYYDNQEFLTSLNTKSSYNFYNPNGNEKTIKTVKEFFKQQNEFKERNRRENMFCKKCGKQIDDSAIMCPSCGAPTDNYTQAQPNVIINNNTNGGVGYYPYKNKLAAALLCFFLGVLGVHRFYVGKIGTGLIWLCTGGLCGFGALVDFIMILVGSFTDKAGYPLR